MKIEVSCSGSKVDSGTRIRKFLFLAIKVPPCLFGLRVHDLVDQRVIDVNQADLVLLWLYALPG